MKTEIKISDFRFRISKWACLFSVLISLWTVNICAQTKTTQEKQKLEKERQKLLKDIELTKKLLEKTSATKKQSLHQLETLQKQIEIRQKVIANITREVKLISREIEEKQEVVNALQNDLNELKKRYADMVVNAYKNKTALNEIVFIFSAHDFNDAFQRLKLIQTLNQFRKRQAELIEETRKELDASIDELKKKKAERLKLLNAEVVQKTELNQEKAQQSNLVQDLKKKEGTLAKHIKQKQADAEKLNKKIQDIIKKEIEAARKKAEAEAKAKNKPVPSSNVSPLAMTPEAAKLSSEFTANQGKLPWPVEKGFISMGFGQQQHPVVKSVVINNNGIDIKTEKEAKVRAVFEGTVTSIISLPGMQRAVMVRHGEFFTLYTNLKEVFVKAGQKISLKDELGVIYTNEEDAKTELHFEIWKGTQTLNPAGWLAK
jgi:septal ring factor EnvC (AmiA/AmiB activator)